MKLLLLSIVALLSFEINAQEFYTKLVAPDNQLNSFGQDLVSFEENIIQTLHSIH